MGELLKWNNALLEVISKVKLVDLMVVRMIDEMGEGNMERFETNTRNMNGLLEGFNEMETINESGYLPDMLLNKAHNIGEMLQEKLEQLPEVERAFVHIDFEFSHRPEHKAKV
ncbi:hypothetical protein Tco_0053521 [Tanacetum coccineum]